ncbi:MAG TPA: hypothetical protein VH208_14315 [Myxococcaceae bacterium]|nr:hypothetical protein [Myxococcaceae bacterium]
MEIVLTAPRSELGRALAGFAGKDQTGRKPGRKVLLNLLAQPPNNLLHDGHRWRTYQPARLVRDTRLALADSQNQDCDLVVHASYAYLRAVESGAEPGRKLAPIVEAALEVEEMVRADPRPSTILRLGYLYGPEFNDLRLYRMAFRIGRPYWAGPRQALHDHIHSADAAAALLAAARGRPVGRAVYATDGHPLSFQSFMDHFARKVGNPLPLHIPGIGRLPAQVVVAEEHMEMVELAVRGAAKPAVAGFSPRFADYKRGIADVLERL